MKRKLLGDNLLALEKDGVAFNYIADGNKNITQLINLTTGEIANKYDYSPFGQLAKTDENVENVFKFSSEYAEKETGLVYYNYRYYNPTTGKWLSRDPIQEKGGYNLYHFVYNRPINYYDRHGLKAASGESSEEKCTVVVMWGHGFNFPEKLNEFNKNDKGCAVASGLGCDRNGLNNSNGIGNDFPNTDGHSIGMYDPSRPFASGDVDSDEANGGRNKIYKDIDDPKLKSAKGFTRLIYDAWGSALRKASEMAEDCKCECDFIKVEFRAVGGHDSDKGKSTLNNRYDTAYSDKKKNKKNKRYIDKYQGYKIEKYDENGISGKKATPQNAPLLPQVGEKHYIKCKSNSKN
ncbi:RHS repeat-associated core domain-containing protein [Lentisphaerota bacterium WC36G]|nr:RHS repeat-associated core domain-containing protein [Lentisphaerae bacterium WC36]